MQTNDILAAHRKWAAGVEVVRRARAASGRDLSVADVYRNTSVGVLRPLGEVGQALANSFEGNLDEAASRLLFGIEKQHIVLVAEAPRNATLDHYA